MELATKRNKSVTKTDLLALVKGQYSGDPAVLLDRVAQYLLQGVSDGLRTSLAKSGRELFASDAAREAVAASLGKMLLDDGANRPVSEAKTLPVSRLSPEEVLKRFGMSKSTLYRGDHTKFYSVVPLGMQNGRAYPAWQFVGDVPSLLPKVLETLNRKSRIQVNTFFVSEQDALNELSPAEVLAGLQFEDRAALAPEQSRMLSLPETVRLDKVIALAALEVADPD
ncbi:hypothetical protein [Paraburkholderia domus]|uniref:Uncharacterized protein n=1 Tax=Paraburkholderia domus TaxID=2793075 RepID=A0A9N8N732_9BURK|nr:hypothetical protein [Paraburkholderia domus]MBK5169447.1 hypothetical protein [Burkholderia sp. R-70211]CAE6959650.1 hypothetical protein R70211_06848 [Paraburkholderia domus]